MEITQVTEYGRINYVSIYQNKPGTYKLTQTATLYVDGTKKERIPKSTIVLVAPGDLAEIKLITDVAQLNTQLPGLAVRAKPAIVYELYDSYGNVIGPYRQEDGTATKDFEEWQRFFEMQYTPEYVQTFLSFKHEDDRNDVKVETRRFEEDPTGNQFITHFTVFQKGNVVIQSPLFKDNCNSNVCVK